jgi:hypothetical protein
VEERGQQPSPSPSRATRRRQPAIRHFACGEWRMLAGGAVAVVSALEYGPKRSGRSASRAPPPVGLENAPAPPPSNPLSSSECSGVIGTANAVTAVNAAFAGAIGNASQGNSCRGGGSHFEALKEPCRQTSGISPF